MSEWTEEQKQMYIKYGRLPKQGDFMKRMLKVLVDDV
jgi:hypothetical protein